MELVEPNERYKASFIEAIKEFQTGEDSYTSRSKRYQKLSIAELEEDFGGYVEKVLSRARGENLPEGFVPATEYWLIDDREFIGSATVRHLLTEKLKKVGGHIGYDIRPSKRGRGYGTKILALALEKARGLGIKRALVTAASINEASKKIIEKNGGKFESEGIEAETGLTILRYFIDT